MQVDNVRSSEKEEKVTEALLVWEESAVKCSDMGKLCDE